MNKPSTKVRQRDKLESLLLRVAARLPESALVRYGSTILIVLAAFFLKLGQNMLLNSKGGAATPFLTFFAAVIIAALLNGWLPGILATLISVLLSNYFFLAPQYSFGLSSSGDIVNQVIFLFEGLVISLLSGSLHLALHRARVEINERIQVAQELQLQREWFAVTLSSIGDAVIATDMQGRVTFMNKVAQDLTEWPYSEAEGRSLEQIFPIINEYTREPVENPVHRVIRENKVVGLANHTLLITRDKREIPIDDSGAPIAGKAGLNRGIVLVFRDVTERKKAEAHQHFLDEASRELATSLDYQTTLQKVARLAVPFLADTCIIYVVKEEGNSLQRLEVVDANPQNARIIEDILEKNSLDQDEQHPVMVSFRSGQSILTENISDSLLESLSPNQEVLKTLQKLNFKSSITVPLVARGQSLGVLNLAYSDSARSYNQADLAFVEELAYRAALAVDNARLYQEAKEAIQDREDFLSVAAHELKTPITAMLGYAQLLGRQVERNQVVDSVRLNRAVNSIQQQSVKLNRLVTQLLDVSRIEAGKLRIDPVLTDVNKLVDSVVAQARTSSNGRDLLLQMPSEPIRAVLDPVRFEQVVVNLVDNALKYSPENSPVSIGLSMESHTDLLKETGMVCLAVSDRGPGIPPERIPYIFDRFYQASETNMLKGMGLGLFITRQIVELHHGKIEIEALPEGGTCFKVLIPDKLEKTLQ
ncbi:MAG TPA: ATP-binding protein [Chloroflexia bacterium]|nr:ATP-binding protein [Chloroflexia bacterium]